MGGPTESRTEEPLGQRIRRLRQERNLSQDRLAIEAHVDQSGLSKFERGADSKRNLGDKALRRIAVILKVSFEDLVTRTDYREL